MGWIAFTAKRSTGGTVNFIAPKVDTPIDIGTGYFTPAEIIQYSDFPIEANVFTFTEALDYIRSTLFPNAINTDDFSGETWTFDNGNYISFGDNGFSLNSKAGKQLFATNYGGRTGFSAHFPRFLVGDTAEGTKSPSGIFFPTTGANKGKVYFYNANPIPNNPVTEPDDILFYAGLSPVADNPDPYNPGGESGPGGGTGTFEDTGDNVDIPQIPTLSATDAGFITLFNPTLAEMINLSSYMWSDLFDISGWKKIFADPMNAILGLSIVPVNVPSSGKKAVKVGNISTGIDMTIASTQYVEVDCGTLDIKEFWGGYLDYDPYTKFEIYLPYIGTHPISTDDIMGKPVHVVYHVDILSGACCAYIKCGDSVLYSFVGQCASSIPITGDNWTNVINGALSIAGAIGSMVATGGASAPMAIGQIASTAVNTLKPSVEKSGSLGGTGGMLGVQTPYLILTRPRQALPKNQNVYSGYPSYITSVLGELKGYTEVDSIHLENVPATAAELAEIEQLLKSGVII